MEWIPQMLLLLVAGWACGAIALGVWLFYKSTAAGWNLGLVAAGIGVASPLVFLMLAGRQLVPSAYLILATPLFPGAVALAVYRHKPPRWLRVLGAIALVVACGLGLVRIHSARQAEQNLIALLTGSPRARLTEIRFSGQQRWVICSDTAVLKYLSDALAHCSTQNPKLGTTYTLHLMFSDGRAMSLPCCSGRDFLTLSVPSLAVEEGSSTHGIVLQPPIPPRVQVLLDFLEDTRWGRRLVIAEDRPVEDEQDQSLLAP